jgi:cytochrome c556
VHTLPLTHARACVRVRAAYYLKDLTKKGNVIQMVQRQRQQKRDTIANKYVKEEEEREKCHQKYSHNLLTKLISLFFCLI